MFRTTLCWDASLRYVPNQPGLSDPQESDLYKVPQAHAQSMVSTDHVLADILQLRPKDERALLGFLVVLRMREIIDFKASATAGGTCVQCPISDGHRVLTPRPGMPKSAAHVCIKTKYLIFSSN